MLWQELPTLRENSSFCQGLLWAAVLDRGAPTYLRTKPHSCQNISVWWPVHIYESTAYKRHLEDQWIIQKYESENGHSEQQWGRKPKFFFWRVANDFSVGVMHMTGELHTFRLGGLRWYLLALCVVILNQVLEEVHSFLGLDLIYFDQVLQSKEKSRVQPVVEIQCVFKGFLHLMRCNVAGLLHRDQRPLLSRIHLEYELCALW